MTKPKPPELNRQGQGGGAPQKYLTPEQIDEVETLAPYLTMTQLGWHFRFSDNTMQEICKRQPEVLGVYRKARAKMTVDISRNMAIRAMEGDMDAMKFWLRTQAGWSEVLKVEMVDVPRVVFENPRLPQGRTIEHDPND